MQVVQTPPIKISPIEDTDASWQYLDGQTPVDFTQTLDGNSWSAEFLIENCDKVEFRTAATLDAEGYISVTIPEATSADLRSKRRIDATYQIRFTSPLPDFDEVWRGPVVVQEVTK